MTIMVAEPRKPIRPVSSLSHRATAGAVNSCAALSAVRVGEMRS